MIKFNSPNSYSFTTGVILFLFGLLGFAFPGSFNVPAVYLLASLVLGVWGIMVSSRKK